MFGNSYWDARLYNSDSYMTTDGRYVYRVWNGATGGYTYTVIVPGQDVPKEIILQLATMDKEEQHELRREARVNDDGFECDALCFGCADKRIENIRDERNEPERIFFHREKKPDADILRLRAAMERLTPAQRDLIYDLYGALMQQNEIAKRDGVSAQAVNNRKDKLINRLYSLMTEDGTN